MQEAVCGRNTSTFTSTGTAVRSRIIEQRNHAVAAHFNIPPE